MHDFPSSAHLLKEVDKIFERLKMNRYQDVDLPPLNEVISLIKDQRNGKAPWIDINSELIRANM